MGDVIRLATLDDAAIVHDVSIRGYKPLKDMDIKFVGATADLATVEENIRRNANYVLERDGRIIATVTVAFPWALGERSIQPYPFIWWFAVDPEFKRQGIGTALLDYVEQHVLVDQIKAPAVYLATATRHPWLVSIYEHRGYVGFYEHEYEGDNIVFLRKVLNEELFAELGNVEVLVNQE
ncbi:GNAT family N-acetyltransferase [Listeria booriae]|uniref:GNAT family N-acetyltransferase n=1 Tax=Listeria booriae TaxID=1552123 RepID=UPI00162A6221|nr:GNAT family N-acetyltransferase [Listeria booriae]MBC1984260.1 GNAT family N-acetyltransferase [Listeria booriae]MBC2047854.1 GNAT family N-acetyltransferase [Listeria booriae]